MPVIKNPFRKNPAHLEPPSSSSVARQGSSSTDSVDSAPRSQAASAINISRIDDDGETYKLSVVNGNGVYLPPSPTEKKSFWKRESSSSSIKNRPPVVPTEEQFVIPRESFDSYRRSFDISARSPISESFSARTSSDLRRPVTARGNSMDLRPSRMSLDVPPRMSLDSRNPRSETAERWSPVLKEVAKDEEGDDDVFEDVKLDEPRPRKFGIFPRFGGDHGDKDAHKDSSRSRYNLFSHKDHPMEVHQESELKRIG